MTTPKGVMIVGEVLEDKIAPVTGGLLAIGRRIADALNQKLSAVLIGSGVNRCAKEIFSLGADEVYIIDKAVFGEYVTDSYTSALDALVRDKTPEVLILGHTPMGSDLAPRLAFRLNTGITLDCVDLTIDPDTKLLQKTKPVYGGNALAVYVCEEGRPQMATVRAKAVKALDPDPSRSGDVMSFDPALDESIVRARIVDRIKQQEEGIKLEDANIVICGGRGIGSSEGFGQLSEIARMFGGAVGGTRPACEEGWLPSILQIGLTGKMVSPALYIGVALSGSSQHEAGMSDSRTIVAINKDPDASIFNIAHYGVVGDYRKVLPPFVEKCRQLLNK
jgi:electron transfer flavoprotein alpha subunit